MFLFVSGLTDSFEAIKKELLRCKREFLSLFSDILQHRFDAKTFEVFHPTVDSIHRSLRPKISLIGFSGVGKTTITQLIKAEEIPMKHVPTITGDIATIKIGKLHFHLWDFAGQEQFSYLWSSFIKGSDAVLLITDSSLENVEKSKFFLELIKEQAPEAHTAVIGNKQDLEESMKPEQIEKIIGLKTYSMIAKNSENRTKMIQIIGDILEMSAEISPLLKPLLERDKLTEEAMTALENAEFNKASLLFVKISDLCLDLGDDSLGKEFYLKSEKINEMLSKVGAAQKPTIPEVEISKPKPVSFQGSAEQAIPESLPTPPTEPQKSTTFEKLKGQEPQKEPISIKITEKSQDKSKFKPLDSTEMPRELLAPKTDKVDKKEKISKKKKKKKSKKKSKKKRKKEKYLKDSEELIPSVIEEPSFLKKPPSPKAIEKPIIQPTLPNEPELKDKIEKEEILINPVIKKKEIGLDLKTEDFLVKKRPKKVLFVPKDAKAKLKTSSYGQVSNPDQVKSQLRAAVTPPNLTKPKTANELVKPKISTAPETPKVPIKLETPVTPPKLTKPKTANEFVKPKIPTAPEIPKVPIKLETPVTPPKLTKPKTANEFVKPKIPTAPEIPKVPIKLEPPVVPKPSPIKPPPIIDEKTEPDADFFKEITTSKKDLENQLMDLKIKKAKLQKMALDFDMQELSGEITTDELNEKKKKVEILEKKIDNQIKELQNLLI